ncbi:arylsulfatase [Bacteroidia bacterium]|nr:arylsulfatase [Bacteroidia bacterium]
MQKNLILIPSLALASVAAYGQKKAAKPAAAKPLNVVLIISDQMSARALPIYGNNTIETPNMQRLVREGVTFDNSVCVAPFSSPTRASLVTGLYPNSTGIITNVEPGKGNGPLDVNKTITEDILFNRGYVTGHFGKWHLGPLNSWPCYANKKNARDIYDRSYFEEFAAMRAANNPVPAQPHNGEVLANAKAEQGYGFYQTAFVRDKWENGPVDMKKDIGSFGRLGTPPELYNWTLVTKDGTDFIEANKKKPFMVTISLGPPHPDFAIPDPWYSRVDPARIPFPPSAYIHPERYLDSKVYKVGQYIGEEGTREKMRCYYAMVTFIDDMIGRILTKLDDCGLVDNTLVVFISDHGDPLNTQGMLFGKTIPDFLEEQLRVPTIMRLPGVIPAGKKLRASFSSVDLAPTMRDYAGVNSFATQGRSFRSLIEGKEKDELGFAVSMRQEARCIRGEIDGNTYIYSKMFNIKAKTSYEQLFDLNADPWQMKNVVDDPAYAKIKVRMMDEFNRYADRTGERHIKDLPDKGLVTTGNFRNDEPAKRNPTKKNN